MDPMDKALSDALDAQLADEPTGDPVETTEVTPPANEPAETPESTEDDTVSPSDEGEEAGESKEKSAARSAAAAQRARDEAGRFKGKDGQPAPTAEKPAAPAQPTAAGPTTEQQPAAAAQPELVDGRDIAKPPSTWKAEAGKDFSKLPREVRAEIHRREESMFKGIEQYKTAANFGTTLAKEFQPYKQMLDAERLAPNDIVKAALAFEYHIRVGSPEQKRTLIENLAKTYKVDLAPAQPQVDDQGNPIQPSAEVVELRNTVSQLQEHIGKISGELNRRAQIEQNAAQEEEQAARTEVQSEISKFASDPANEFYNDVRADMLSLLQSRQATGLKDAYDKAIWTNPVTREKLIARQREADQKKAAEAAAAAQKANRTNVTPRTTPQGKTAGKGTMDSVLNAEIDRALKRA